jgi:hypothetical protein
MVIQESILIDAKMDIVWKTFTDLTCWKDWNTVMRDVSSNEKRLSCGGEISCCFRPFLLPIDVTVRVEEVILYERVVWSTQKKGFSARNEFSFQDQERGVLVTSRETFTGFLVRAFGCFLPKRRMRSLIHTFLKDLKTASEKQFIQ